MNFPLDISIDKEPFQYVINIIKGKGDPYISPDGMVRIFPSMIKLTMPDDALFIFQERYNSGEIHVNINTKITLLTKTCRPL